MLGPEIQAAARIVHIVRTGYSSHSMPCCGRHASRNGSRFDVSCSLSSWWTLSE
jgi:hypothetical protein